MAGKDTPILARRVATHMGQPAVLFIDDRGWDCFFQLAAGIKKAGIRTVRITNCPRSLAASFFVFDRTIRLGALSDLIDLPGILEGEHIIDMQMTETMSVAAGEGIMMMPECLRTTAWSRRVAVMDKTFVAERLRACGLSTPPLLTGPDLDAGQVIEELGLPVVRKLRAGSGGVGISIIYSREDLETLVAKGELSDEYFYEQYVEGRQLQFGGVFGDGEDDTVVTYETLQRRGALAPASEIRLINDPTFAETGRAIVAALGITGLMNVNVIRDAKGRDWIHDVNPRVFGSFMAFRPVGVDLLKAYIGWALKTSGPEIVVSLPSIDSRARRTSGEAFDGGIQMASGTKSTSREKGRSRLLVFPAAFRGHTDGESRLRTIYCFLRVAYPYLRWLGSRYVAYEIGRQLLYEVEYTRHRHGRRAIAAEGESSDRPPQGGPQGRGRQ